MLCGSTLSRKAADLKESFPHSEGLRNFNFIDLQPPLLKEPPSPDKYHFVSNTQPLGVARWVLFTSGTTGPPNGVVYSYEAFEYQIQMQVSSRSLKDTDTMLHRSPVHWGGGFNSLSSNIVSGTCIEFCSAVFSESWFGERIRKGDAKLFIFTPELYSTLGHYFQDHIEARPGSKEYIDAIENVKLPIVARAPLSEPIQKF